MKKLFVIIALVAFVSTFATPTFATLKSNNLITLQQDKDKKDDKKCSGDSKGECCKDKGKTKDAKAKDTKKPESK